MWCENCWWAWSASVCHCISCCRLESWTLPLIGVDAWLTYHLNMNIKPNQNSNRLHDISNILRPNCMYNHMFTFPLSKNAAVVITVASQQEDGAHPRNFLCGVCMFSLVSDWALSRYSSRTSSHSPQICTWAKYLLYLYLYPYLSISSSILYLSMQTILQSLLKTIPTLWLSTWSHVILTQLRCQCKITTLHILDNYK